MGKYLRNVSDVLSQYNISIFKDKANTELKTTCEVLQEIAMIYHTL